MENDFIEQIKSVEFAPICFSKDFDEKHCKCCFGKNKNSGWMKFSKASYKIVENKYFDFFIIAMTILSSIELVKGNFSVIIFFENKLNSTILKALEDKFVSEKPAFLRYLLDLADYVFAIIFTLEMLLLWSAYGFRKYFTNGWCWIDFIIVIVCQNL